ncbi:hydroxyisourate hydrolase [Telmatospirillum sp. J64-1]|uniref:hydroxyisourate hydrolase n=1 Tax=Telmatospirillum sp. J64-1 TaxID=2502183 RepID=UPI001C8F6BC1|nr:hydroxyisourate hydrolase [Telmatospirillum sp. J64-1]
MVVPNPTGRLTTHVLDTATGRPASGMRLFLHAVDGSERRLLGEFVTNADGRLDAPALSGAELKAGTYELEFLAGAYFSATCQPTAAPSFLDRIPLRFAIGNPEQHYHVPLLVSPWSYSTYRGS